MWTAQMLDGIKQNKNRMLIAMEIGVSVSAISRAALQMINSHEYRDAGISDEQFATWFDASLIGLQTVDGEPATERTEPDEKHVDMLLRRIYSEPVKEYNLDRIKSEQGKIKVKNCFNCKMYGTFVCSHYNNNDNGTYAIVCKNYRR